MDWATLFSMIYVSGLPLVNPHNLRTTDILIIGDLETGSSGDQKATSQMGRMIMNHNSNKFGYQLPQTI